MEQALSGIETQMVWEAPTPLSRGKGDGNGEQGTSGWRICSWRMKLS